MTMIKKLAFAGVAALAFAAAPAAAAGYTAPTANGKATVRLYNQITLSKVTDIDYGVVIRNAAGWGSEVISMDNAGALNCGTAVNMSCTGSPSVGEFTIQGDLDSEMSVEISGADYNEAVNELTLHNGADSLIMAFQVSGMTQDLDATTSAPLTTWSLTGTGADQTLLFYGDLTVQDLATAANGVYEANYTLTADYK